MASNQGEDLWYVEYSEYDYVKKQHTDAIKYDFDENDLNKIMLTMLTLNPKLNKKDAIIKNLYRLLSNSQVFLSGSNKNYCKYINYWLNEEYSKNNNQSNIPNFNFFKDFVYELNREKYGNQKKNNSCKEYIKHLDAKIFNNITYLHRLYDAYNEIKTTPITNVTNTCSNMVSLSKSYRISIDDHYDNDKHLYEKLDTIKKLILGKIRNINSDCVNNIYFPTPKKLVELQKEQERKKAEEDATRQAEEDATRQAEEEAKRLQIERDREQQILLQSTDLLGRSTDELQGMSHGNRESQSTSYLDSTRELGNSGFQRYTQKFGYSERPESSTALSWNEGHTPRGQMTYTIKGTEHQNEVIQEQEDKGTTRPGTLGGSTGFPGYITEVFRSVEPAPILGVSGGMGALFLLFKYTPVGSFFGGRRGRFRQIPSSFRKFPPGEFPIFQENDVGYIGYGAMNASPFAE